MIPKFRAWYTPFKGEKFGQEMKYGQAGRLITHAEMAPDQYVLMQSTGLKDKNGVEIFEGDIVKKTNGSIGYVVYLQQEAGFVVVLKKSDYRLGHRNTGESYTEATNHEVIGNIYENPELLEEVK
ncbi:YopX family protein [Enterococcus mundtii]|uniref:YopX family protein n=1 Tax=Enterococcus mundtii TaxID=53346 RepID=UPI002DB88398|nr:YopX family protein [Enterococcus mundtii]MEC3942085.1 YopX family protein [Enterococcus mundtii]